MGAVPKKKPSRAKTRQRRAHWHAETAALVRCPRCRSPRLPHHACPVCGTYRGRQVVPVEVPGR
ncbi:MAG TPA: 50S ribosomal protein L32 [Dehalococcoidia bacterium]|nr:50S ribosomal protein L32 [Dehalococcoidia bacterium]